LALKEPCQIPKEWVVDENLRRQPAQDRSAQRFDLILDTAAALVDQYGIAGVSPTLIARTAGMTGPAIYRYFDDMSSVFRALAARNVERFFASLQQILANPKMSWEDAVRASVDLYANMYRSEPGFARLRLGEGLDKNALNDVEGNGRVVAAAAVAHFQPRYETWDRPLMTEHIEVMVHLIFALVARAFENDRDGEPFFLSEAKRLSVTYLANFLATVPGIAPDTQHAAAATA
jgi:AcrR family transcriptional regulator